MSKMKKALALGLDPASFSFGMKVRYCRVRIDMSATEFAMLYAEAMGQKEPYSGIWIEQMEHDDTFPSDPGRRWAIASIVKMGLYFDLSTLGIEAPLLETPRLAISELDLNVANFEIEDHETFLRRSWTQGFRGTLEEAEREILARMDDISVGTSYVSSQRRRKAWRTLCGLHILLATDVYSAKNDAAAMTQETRMAALLARENGFSDLYVIARSQLGLFLKTQGNYPAAFENFRVVKRMKNLPEQLRGGNLSEAASTRARIARTEKEKDMVKKLFDEAEGLINGSTLDDFDFLFHFDNSMYWYDRGSALIRSPVKELRDPETALSYLPVLYRADAVPAEDFQIVGHRQVSNHILQAEIAIEQEDYPTAISLAEEALNYSEQLQSKAHLKKLLQVYQALKRSPSGNDDRVMMLEIRLARNLYPERFC